MSKRCCRFTCVSLARKDKAASVRLHSLIMNVVSRQVCAEMEHKLMTPPCTVQTVTLTLKIFLAKNLALNWQTLKKHWWKKLKNLFKKKRGKKSQDLLLIFLRLLIELEVKQWKHWKWMANWGPCPWAVTSLLWRQYRELAEQEVKTAPIHPPHKLLYSARGGSQQWWKHVVLGYLLNKVVGTLSNW